MNTNETELESERRFHVIVVATSSKEVPATPNERIGTLKRAAMRLFDIPQDKADEYRLAASPGDPAAEMDDGKTVANYHLHEGSKLFLVKPHNDA